jgi:GT2 family glycosyltransferase
MNVDISYQKGLNYGNAACKFSILIPSWNNLPFLKCVVQSILKNSTYQHQIIVHLNEANDGSLEWCKANNLCYSISTENVGVCYGFNAASYLATTDYIVLIDDDMYVAPNWDAVFLQAIERETTDKWCMSGTMIEPFDKKNPCVIANKNFGLTPDVFEEAKFLATYHTFPMKEWNGSCWYPLVLRRSVWNAIGGLSIEFSPGMWSDPDFMIKLWHYGIRDYKGLSECRVYHFGSRTTQRVVRNDGKKTFVKKWEMGSSTFYKYFLRIGEPYKGILELPTAQKVRAKIFIDKLKSRFK